MDNERADGSIYRAPPVVVLDTTNATIATKDGNQASEISEAINAVKQRFGDIPCIAIGHVSKAAADKQAKITTKGSGSWEDDAQQVLYLEASKRGRFLTLDKRRFETEITRYELDSRYATFEAENELGVTVQVKCVYGWPKPADDEIPDQCKEFKDSELLSKVVEVVKTGFGLNQVEVCKAVGGNKSTVVAAIASGVEAGNIRIEAGPNGSRLHFYNELSSKF